MTRKTKSQKSQKNEENVWLETVKTLAYAGILAFGIRTFVAEARYIPSSSMEPTLQINDHLMIEKVSYHFKEPQRGDIVVFKPPKEAIHDGDYNTAFIKRIIGLPGDTIQVKQGIVYVNGQPITEDYIKEAPKDPYGPVTVPEDHYLVLGDNRNNSSDSRFWGFVPRENFIGRAFVRFWPINRLGNLQEDSHSLYPALQN